MALTDLQVRRAQARDKAYKLSDGGGLYVYVSPTGHKSWRMKYQFARKEKRLVFGGYPEIGLARARELRDDARRLLREHRDPALEAHKRKIDAHAAAGATFEKFALLWHAAQTPRWSVVNARKVEQALRRDVFPTLGRMPLVQIDGPMVLKVLRAVEKRGAIDTAKRIRQHVSAVFQFAMAEGVVGHDPAAGIKKALAPTPPGGKQPALKSLAAARKLLADMETTTSTVPTKLASRLLAITAVRPGIVRAAEWTEFEGIDWADPDAPAEDALWRIPAERMKLEQEDKSADDFEHEVPLPPQAVDVLRAMRRLTGRSKYVFTSVRSFNSPMSENTIGYMYARNGYSGRHVPHGWRSTFSTVMNELAVKARRPEDRAIIDGMLAHKPKGVSASEMAYNRALHWERRCEIAREWAELIVTGLVAPASLMASR